MGYCYYSMFKVDYRSERIYSNVNKYMKVEDMLSLHQMVNIFYPII